MEYHIEIVSGRKTRTYKITAKSEQEAHDRAFDLAMKLESTCSVSVTQIEYPSVAEAMIAPDESAEDLVSTIPNGTFIKAIER